MIYLQLFLGHYPAQMYIFTKKVYITATRIAKLGDSYVRSYTFLNSLDLPQSTALAELVFRTALNRFTLTFQARHGKLAGDLGANQVQHDHAMIYELKDQTPSFV